MAHGYGATDGNNGMMKGAWHSEWRSLQVEADRSSDGIILALTRVLQLGRAASVN